MNPAYLVPVLLAGAQPAGGSSVELGLLPLAMGLFGGLALFLFGMDQMSGALKAIAGERMKKILGRLTQNRLIGIFTGAFITAVIQSSSVTTVLVVGFITAGLMSMTQSIGVIMGANIGTTITAQIIAFKITEFALLLIAVGFAGKVFGRKLRHQQQGVGLMGLGLIFFGMGVMGEAMSPLRDYEPFLDWMIRMESPAVGILAGALFTALVQSSSATTGIVIVMASQGLLSLPAGIALAFGANIGTCVTALLAAIGKPREALRAAMVHVLFNVLGVLIWLPFIKVLASLVAQISPRAPDLDGMARLAAEVPRQIANAHTVFNVVNTFLFIGLATQFARLVERLVPDRPIGEEDMVRAKYLDEALLATPSLALDRVRLEILHMGEYIGAMMEAILPAICTGSRESLLTVAAMDDAVDMLHGQVVTYLGRISQKQLTDQQTEEFLGLMEAANSLENVGDIIETNLVTLGLQRIDLQFRMSPKTTDVIGEFHRKVNQALDASVQAATQKNERAAQVVMEMKQEINHLAESAARHQVVRLVAEEPNRLPAYTVETDILQNLKRIYYFAKRMARSAVPAVDIGA